MIIVLSQEEGYNAAQAKLLETDIIKQARTMEKVIEIFYLLPFLLLNKSSSHLAYK